MTRNAVDRLRLELTFSDKDEVSKMTANHRTSDENELPGRSEEQQPLNNDCIRASSPVKTNETAATSHMTSHLTVNQASRTNRRPSRGRVVEFIGLKEAEEDDEDEDEDPSKESPESDFHGPGALRFNTVPVCRRACMAGSSRLRQPRLSLLGKPLNYHAHRRDTKFRRIQTRLYNFLERPKDWKEISYHLLVFLMVFLCLLLSIFSTFEHYEDVSGFILYYLEVVMVVWFTTELIVRIWSAGCRSRYQKLTGRLQFMRRPLCIVDITVISASVIILCMGSSGQVFATSALRGLRFFQILRMVRVDRRGGSWKLLGSVVWAHRQELFTTLYIGFLGLIFSSFLVYLAEKEKNPKKFGTYADALWWGVITLCTVGYGDTVPITWPGKMIAAFCAVLGISFFALPAGILGSGFALKVQQQQRQKHLIRRRVPAAALIQAVWRCYAADKNSMSLATWTPHLKANSSPQVDVIKFKSNQSFMSRLSTRRKDRSTVDHSSSNASPSSPLLARQTAMRRMQSLLNHHNSDDKDSDSVEKSHQNSFSESFGSYSVSALFKRTFDGKDSEDDQEDGGEKLTMLTDVQKQGIRSLRKIKYFVARRKFKEALRPYDVKDVIEQYSAGHMDMLTRIKSLQSRMDLIVGKSQKSEVHETKYTVSSRIVKVERHVTEIEGKLDMLLAMYREDRRKFTQPDDLIYPPPLMTTTTSLITGNNSQTSPMLSKFRKRSIVSTRTDEDSSEQYSFHVPPTAPAPAAVAVEPKLEKKYSSPAERRRRSFSALSSYNNQGVTHNPVNAHTSFSFDVSSDGPYSSESEKIAFQKEMDKWRNRRRSSRAMDDNGPATIMEETARETSPLVERSPPLFARSSTESSSGSSANLNRSRTTSSSPNHSTTEEKQNGYPSVSSDCALRELETSSFAIESETGSQMTGSQAADDNVEEIELRRNVKEFQSSEEDNLIPEVIVDIPDRGTYK